ncbi:MAG: B-box zinc finger protein [Acidobacteriota bacterium]|jgi:hypothetical protein
MADQQTCAVHQNTPAAYRCDGCHRGLCDDCVQMSHRLILCPHCGEMAIPVATGQAVSTTEVRRHRAVARPYSLAEAFLYPLRGQGSGVFWSYVVLLAIFATLPLVIPFSGCILLLPELLIALMVPRLLFTIVRATAEGDNELPEWPEFDFWARLVDALAYALIILIAWIPTVALVSFSNCGGFGLLERMAGMPAPEGPSCWPPLILGFFLSMALWIPTLGAQAVYDSFWLLPRVDLHLRALLAAPAEAAVISVLLAGLLLLGYGVATAFNVIIPIIGVPIGTALGVYTTFTGSHLVGVYFRRHSEKLERLYLG